MGVSVRLRQVIEFCQPLADQAQDVTAVFLVATRHAIAQRVNQRHRAHPLCRPIVNGGKAAELRGLRSIVPVAARPLGGSHRRISEWLASPFLLLVGHGHGLVG
ncbi:hypothetical protein EGJ57_21830 [Brucella anthropi]|nr:hypothetical protein EGJ57_21830 [Brucella anthropi]